MWKRYRLQQQSSDGGAGGGAGAGGGDGGAGGAGAGGAAANWYGADTNKAVVESKGFKGVDDVFTWATNAEKLIGAERAGRTLIKPKDEKDVEGIKAFRTGLGVPESPDKYELPVPQGGDPAFAKTASAWFHEAGIPKDAAQKIAGKWNEHLEAEMKNIDAQLQAESGKQLDALKGEWGADYDKNAEQARRFMKAAGFDDEKVARYEAAFGTADMLKTFSNLGAKLGEAGFVKGDGHGSGSLNPQQAKEKLDGYRADRIAGKITENDWMRYMELYGPAAAKAA